MNIFDLRQHLLKGINTIPNRQIEERRIANGANPRHRGLGYKLEAK
ncbi:MAG: hypothetical protein KGZ49_03370 [Syntrophaceae bacterium]|nr:hypothetical protein [Syntrophaceae bacterium]